MSVIYPPDSEYAKESVKWEAQGSIMGPGLRPYVYREFPWMMYKAGRPTDDHGEPKMGPHTIVEARAADSQKEFDLWWHEGFRGTPLEALDAFEAQQLEFAKLAAEITYDVKKKLSPNAGAEVEYAQSQHAGHMPVVPSTPIKRRAGRPKKLTETGA